jgi:hypothetical protein
VLNALRVVVPALTLACRSPESDGTPDGEKDGGRPPFRGMMLPYSRDECPRVVCKPAFTIQTALAVALDSVIGSKVRVCVNENCLEGIVPTLVRTDAGEPRVELDLRDGNRHRVSVTVIGEPKSPAWFRTTWASSDKKLVDIGDTVTITLETRSGNRLHRRDRVIAQSTSDSDGELCERMPCQSLDLVLAFLEWR